MKKSIFLSLVSFCIVLAVSVIIIFYANGYTYNKRDKKLEKTGIVKVQSTPSNAVVFIDTINDGTTPISITNLTQGNHILEVRKSGYLTWSSKIKIQGGLIDLVTPVLYPSDIKPSRIEANNSLNSVFFSRDIYAYTSPSLTNASETDIRVHVFGSGFLNLGESTNISVNIPSLNLASSYALTSITFSPNKSRMLLTFSANNLPTKYFLASVDGSSTPQDLNTIIDTALYSKISWGNDDTHLTLSNGNLLIYLDTSDSQRIILAQADISSTITDFEIANNICYYIIQTNQTKNYSLLSTQLDGTGVISIEAQSTLIESLLASDTNNQDYAYLSAENGLTISVPSIQSNLIRTKQQYTPLSFSSDGKYLLVKDLHSNLYTYSIETNTFYSLGLESKGTASIIWARNSDVLLYTTTIDNPPYYSIHGINYDGTNNDVLFKGSITDPSLLVSPNSSDLLFEMDNLSLNNTPEKGLYSISIPGL